MKKRISREVKIGIYSISMIVLLYLGINFIKSKKLFSSDHVFYATYSQADGIEVSSPVVIKGFRVGTVDKISFDIKNSTVVVKMSVDKDYPIPSDSKAKISATSLLGGKVIDIQLGNAATELKSGDAIESSMDQNLLEVAGDEYAKLKTMASTMIEQLSKALSNLNAVLSDENVKNISGTLANLNSMSSNLDGLVTSEGKNIKTLIENLNQVSLSLKQDAPKLGYTLDNVQQLTDSLTNTIPAVVANFNQTIDQLNSTLAKINRGEGSIGKLANDEQLYDNLISASNSLTLLLQDFKANPRRYIQFSVFGKKDKITKK